MTNNNFNNNDILFKKTFKIVSPYYGMELEQLTKELTLESTAKNVNQQIIINLIKQKDEALFISLKKANIKLKTIVVYQEDTFRLKESMSFKPFEFEDIINENWNQSHLQTYFMNLKLYFFIFIKNKGVITFKKLIKHEFSSKELKYLEITYMQTRNVLLSSEPPYYRDSKGKVHTNFPKLSDNIVFHLRPHAAKSDYNEFGRNASYIKTSKTWMTRHSFWLNSKYILEEIIMVDLLT